MPTAQFFTTRHAATDALQRFARSLVAALPDATINTGHCHTNLKNGHVPIPTGTVKTSLAELAASPQVHLQKIPCLHLKDLDIQLAGVSSAANHHVNVHYSERENAVGAEITISSTELWNEKSLLRLVDALHAEFTLRRHDILALEATSKGEREVLRAYENSLSALQTNVAELGTVIAAQEKRLGEFLIQKTQQLEERYAAKEQQLEERATARENAVTEREARVREREEAIDAQDRTTTRRELLRKMREALEQRKDFRVSSGTVAKRNVITSTCVVAMAVGLAFAGFPAWAIVMNGFEWTRAAPMSAGIALFASTLVFFIRWNDAWFRDHARAEFQAMRNHSDILRASWIAELYFEWTEAKDTEFPPVLAERLTQNLFTENADGSIKHPVEQVASALKSLHFKAGEIELDTRRKS